MRNLDPWLRTISAGLAWPSGHKEGPRCRHLSDRTGLNPSWRGHHVNPFGTKDGPGTTLGREAVGDGLSFVSGAAPAASVSVDRTAPGHLAKHALAGRRGASRDNTRGTARRSPRCRASVLVSEVHSCAARRGVAVRSSPRGPRPWLAALCGCVCRVSSPRLCTSAASCGSSRLAAAARGDDGFYLRKRGVASMDLRGYFFSFASGLAYS